jgi:hypothetical protein
MAETPLSKKLLIKSGCRVLLLHPPDGYAAQLEPLPADVTIVHEANAPCDVVQLFVRQKADVDREVPQALAAVKPGGVFWICYPKRTANVPTDIHRDVGWEALYAAGWGPVTQIALDATWSALRFKPEHEVQRKPGSVAAPPRKMMNDDG